MEDLLTFVVTKLLPVDSCSPFLNRRNLHRYVVGVAVYGNAALDDRQRQSLDLQVAVVRANQSSQLCPCGMPHDEDRAGIAVVILGVVVGPRLSRKNSDSTWPGTVWVESNGPSYVEEPTRHAPETGHEAPEPAKKGAKAAYEDHVAGAVLLTVITEYVVQTSLAVQAPEALGFRTGTSSVHTSRTMMLDELSLVLEKVGSNARSDAYLAAIVEENALGKPTQTTRQRTAKRLTELYCLAPACTLFRLLRHFWSADQAARPMLALLTAAARDPLLRETTPFVQGIVVGEAVAPDQIAKHLDEKYPKRFQSSTALATAQRLASSWMQAGYLNGKVKKKRSRPVVTPVVAAFAVLLGYLAGFRGKLLLDSTWTRLLGRTPAELTDLVGESSRQGWLTYKAVGSVVEITFPGLLRPQEEKASYEQD